MITVVTGCGRSGTNIALEILTGHYYFQPSQTPEDKKIFQVAPRMLPNYLTKCDTCYYTKDDLERTKRRRPDLKLVWCIRDPRDMALSKLYRGRPESEGGDCQELADDASLHGLFNDLRRMTSLYNFANIHYPDDIILIKMEDSVLNTEAVAKRLCDWVGIEYINGMVDFPDRMRNRHKRQRYGNSIDKSQVRIYRNWETAYGGWFKDRDFLGVTIPDLFVQLGWYCERFGYV